MCCVLDNRLVRLCAPLRMHPKGTHNRDTRHGFRCHLFTPATAQSVLPRPAQLPLTFMMPPWSM